MPEGVLLLGQQVRHRVDSDDVWAETTSEWFRYGSSRTSEYGNGGLVPFFRSRPDLARVLAADDVEPLLHFVLVLELGRSPYPLGREELVEIELVELALRWRWPVISSGIL